MHEVLLHEGDESQDVARECIRTPDSLEPAEHVRVELQKDLSHDQPFLEAVEQEPLAVRGVVSKQARAEAVKGGDPCLAVLVLQAPVDAARYLVRRARGEGEDEDLLAAGQALAHGLLVQVDQGMRFAGARPGEHAQWSFDFVDVEWQMVPLSGAGELIMRGPGSSSQPCLLRVARRPRPWPAAGPTRSTPIDSSSDRCRRGTRKGSRPPNRRRLRRATPPRCAPPRPSTPPRRRGTDPIRAGKERRSSNPRYQLEPRGLASLAACKRSRRPCPGSIPAAQARRRRSRPGHP